MRCEIEGFFVFDISFWQTSRHLHHFVFCLVHLDHLVAPVAVAPLDVLVEDAEWHVHEPHVVFNVVDHGAISPLVPTNFVHDSTGMLLRGGLKKFTVQLFLVAKRNCPFYMRFR